MSHKYLDEAVKSTCRYAFGRGIHGPIVAKGRSKLITDYAFDICDLHLGTYQRAGQFEIRLNYGKADPSKDISSDKAVARRAEQAVGVQSDLRSQSLDSRKDLL
jgi:hypothetical protein